MCIDLSLCLIIETSISGLILGVGVGVILGVGVGVGVILGVGVGVGVVLGVRLTLSE
jgi:hypothetical protein